MTLMSHTMMMMMMMNMMSHTTRSYATFLIGITLCSRVKRVYIIFFSQARRNWPPLVPPHANIQLGPARGNSW